MKACNFASLDPAQRDRGITALANVSAIDTQVWKEFSINPEAIAAEAERAYDQLLDGVSSVPSLGLSDDPRAPSGPTDREQLVRVRRVQGFFRSAVLISYGHQCAITGLDVPELLTASHIIPWADSSERRADPWNGLCLNALLDRAFDRGLIAIDVDFSVLISPRLKNHHSAESLLVPGGLAGRRLRMPHRFLPDPNALAHHRERIFH